MRLRSGTRTDIGRKRQSNEDCFAALDDRALYVVADGMGGHAAGAVAARIAVDRLVLELESARPGAERLRRAIRAANEAVHARASAERAMRGMGTTVAALWIAENVAHVAHVGDSRVYRLRGGSFAPLTLDHSPLAERIFRGRMPATAARLDPVRHVITRAVGVRPTVEPDVASVPVHAGDAFLLCTDGVTSLVEEGEIAGVVADCRDDLATAAEVLIEVANSRGGDDNSTAVIVVCE
jgi:serine/threonine protein phosphatase PrpC